VPISPRSRPIRLALLALTGALALGACTNAEPPSPTGGAPSPRSSGTAACPTAPTPPDNLEGWGPPADPPQTIPVIINPTAQLVCGQNRLMFTIVDKDSRPIGSPDRTATVALYNLGRDASNPIATVDGTFVWAIEDSVGIYVGNVTFPESGRYGAEFSTAADGAAETIRLTFDVQPSTTVVGVGDPAPASTHQTLDDVGGDATHISTDPSPDPRLYETSIDAALAADKPFVVIFATPKFCKTAQCGPTLSRIKPFVDRYPDVTFINIEPYKLKLVDGVLQADVNAQGELQPTAVVDDWNLVIEPTVYVVDRTGVVTANFELIFSDAELTAALDAVQ
jgi:hypothetical protein